MINHSMGTRIAIFAALPGLLLACASATAQSPRSADTKFSDDSNFEFAADNLAGEADLHANAPHISREESSTVGFTSGPPVCDSDSCHLASNTPCLANDGCARPSYQEDTLRLRCLNLAYASADALFLGKDDNQFRIVGMQGMGEFFEGELTHGFEPGFRVNLGLRLWDNVLIEGRHARVDGWEAQGNWEPLSTDPDALAVRGDFLADFHSTDINLVVEDWINNEYQVLLGLRFTEFRDSFSATLSNSSDTESFSGTADNSLLGIQTGIRTGWFFRRSVWSVSLIGGVFRNEISQTGPTYSDALAVDVSSDPAFAIQDDEISAFVDFEASVAYPLSPFAAVRIGYQGLLIDNLATVTRQNGASADPGSIYFHGGFVGLELFH